jgi:hypothetical protein
MTRTQRRRTRAHRWGVLTAVGAVLALAATLITTTTASAAVNLKYTVTGSAHVVKMGTDIPVEGTVDVQLDATTGNFTSKFTQTAPVHVAFKAFGMLDTTVDVEFFEAAPSSGKIVQGKVDFTLPLQIRLRNINSIGLPIGGGDKCVQTQPPTLVMHSVGTFEPTVGGDLESDPFTVSTWVDAPDACGVLTGLVNESSSGPDNTAKVTLKHQAG